MKTEDTVSQQADNVVRDQQAFAQNPYQQPWNTPSGTDAYWHESSPAGQSQPGAFAEGSYSAHTNATFSSAPHASTSYYRSQPQQGVPIAEEKDHVVAGLLALFLGAMGIHKFYLGYNTAGFIMLGVSIVGSLLTIGLAGAVMGVIGMVEGIIYLTKSQADFEAEYLYRKKEWF